MFDEKAGKQLQLDSDEALYMRYKADGSHEAFAELMQRCQKAVYCTALGVCGNAATAEEATQETFIRLAMMKHKYQPRGGSSFRSWLHQIAVNQTRMSMRGERRRRKREQKEPAVETQVPTPEFSSMNKETAVLLRQALAGLDVKLRVPVVLRFFNNMELGEIAAVIGVSHVTAGERVQKGLSELRMYMIKRGVSMTPVALGTVLSNWAADMGLSQALVDSLAKLKIQLAVWKPLAAISSGLSHGGTMTATWKIVAVFSATIGLIIAGGLWLNLSKSGAPIDPMAAEELPTNAEGEKIRTKQEADKSTTESPMLFCDFNDGKMPSELRVLVGDAVVRPDGGVGNSGCLETQSDRCALLIGVDPNRLPLVIDCVYQMLPPAPKGNYLVQIVRRYWPSESASFHFGSVMVKEGEWINFRAIVTDRTMDIQADKQRCLIYVVEKSAPSPYTFSFRGRFRLDNVTVKTIRTEDIPDFSDFVNFFDQTKPVERVGERELEGWKSPLTGKNIKVRFFRRNENDEKNH